MQKFTYHYGDIVELMTACGELKTGDRFRVDYEYHSFTGTFVKRLTDKQDMNSCRFIESKYIFLYKRSFKTRIKVFLWNIRNKFLGWYYVTQEL